MVNGAQRLRAERFHATAAAPVAAPVKTAQYLALMAMYKPVKAVPGKSLSIATTVVANRHRPANRPATIIPDPLHDLCGMTLVPHFSPPSQN